MRPSTGVVLPRCRVPVQVIQVPDGGDSGTPPRGGAAARTPPPNPGRDKFLVQAVRMPNIEGDSAETAQELFSRAGGQQIQELKLRVYPAVAGADSPAPSGGASGGGSKGAGATGGGTPSRGGTGRGGGVDGDARPAPGSPTALPKSSGGQVSMGMQVVPVGENCPDRFPLQMGVDWFRQSHVETFATKLLPSVELI